MGLHNSLSVYTDLVVRLHADIAERYSCKKDTVESHERDSQEIAHRVHLEGLGFLTKTLPALGKAIDLALQDEHPLSTPAFQKDEGELLPKFLRPLLRRVFSERSAMVLPPNEVDTKALADLRTLTMFLYKLEVPYEKKTEQSVIDSFITTEEELANHQFPPQFAPIMDGAQALLAVIFHRVRVRDITPKHGPGSVSTGEVGPEKLAFSRRYLQSEWYYPVGEYFFVSENMRRDIAHWISRMKPMDRATAKVVLVPKDSRGPRLISCEPLEIQWLQQGLHHLMVEATERHPLTRGHVNFTCQDINRAIALRSSKGHQPSYRVSWAVNRLGNGWWVRHDSPKIDSFSHRVPAGEWVTLDMKDASDRVSLRLVDELFALTPLRGPLKATRSAYTRLPSGKVIKLHKFAPMGSAVCFPVEALCFWSIMVAALVHVNKISYEKACGRVYVYGDDLIVHREDYPVVIQYLSYAGLKTNVLKCCVSGFFRESCGCDAFNGVDVTPLRLRKTWGHRGATNGEELVSWVSLAERLREKGYWWACDYVFRLVESRYGTLPEVPYSIDKNVDMPSPRNSYRCSRVIGWSHATLLAVTLNNAAEMRRRALVQSRRRRYNGETQTYQQVGWVVTAFYGRKPTNQWLVLNHALIRGGKGNLSDVYAVPNRARLKWGIGR